MLKASFQQMYSIQEVIGLSCNHAATGNTYSLCHIKRKGEEISFVKRELYDNDVAMLRYLMLRKNVPIALHIQGNAVLIKEVPLVEEITTDFIQSVFPSYKPEEYMYCYFRGDALAWISLARSALLNEYKATLAGAALNIVSVFIGPFVLENILDQLNGYSGYYTFDGHIIHRQMETKQWSTYRYDVLEKSRFKVKVQGMDIEERAVLAYAAGFSLLMYNYLDDLHVNNHTLAECFEELLQKNRFIKNSMFVLFMFFLALLINSLLYLHYKGKYRAIDWQSKVELSNSKTHEKHTRSIALNDSLLNLFGWNGGIPKSWLMNQLANTIANHKGLVLQVVYINPPVSKTSTAVQGHTAANRYNIQVSGYCENLADLDNWITNLNKLLWLRRVSVSKFIESNKANGTRKEFELLLEYTYDF